VHSVLVLLVPPLPKRCCGLERHPTANTVKQIVSPDENRELRRTSWVAELESWL